MNSNGTSSLLVLAFLLMTACSRGPYADLERAFPAQTAKAATPIRVRAMVLVGPKQEGAYNYKNMIKLGLTPAAIAINPTSPFMKQVEIKVSAISGCSKTCFGRSRWDADILIAEPPVEISFENSSEVIDWCWSRQLRIVSANERTDWLYRSKPLVKKQAGTQLRSRATYDEALRQACLGF